MFFNWQEQRGKISGRDLRRDQMKLKISIFLFTVMAILLMSCSTATSTQVVETQTRVATVTTITPEIDPVAVMDAKRAEVLTYLTDLSNEPFKGVISGQNAYHGTEILAGYTTMIEKLHLETGKYVGIVGVDYEFAKLFKPSELSQTNEVLIKYASEGGLVMITLAP